jgi:hypothetical protein
MYIPAVTRWLPSCDITLYVKPRDKNQNKKIWQVIQNLLPLHRSPKSRNIQHAHAKVRVMQTAFHLVINRFVANSRERNTPNSRTDCTAVSAFVCVHV